MKCSDVLTRDPVCCLPDDTVEQAAQSMKKEDVGPIPVIENRQSKKLLGIVTDRDMAVKVVAEGRDNRKTKVKEIMTRNPVTCHPNDDLQVALDAMAQHQIRRVPVVDDQGRITGIIAQADVATRTDDPEKTADVVEEISRSTIH
jgi:CBS domain-containing protein